MNKEQAVGKLLESLAEVMEWVKATKTFVLSQAPDICREIVLWTIWKNGLYAGLLWGLILFGTVLIYRSYKKYGVVASDGAPLFMLYIIGFMLICIPGMEASQATLNMVQAIIAPKLTIINYITERLK